MNSFFIKNYINKMNKNDLYNLASKYGIFLNNNELESLYSYIKSNYNDYFNGAISDNIIITNARKILSSDNYNKLISLYNSYKK